MNMAEIGKEVIIVGYSNLTNEGLVLHLNRAAKLKTGNVATKEFWISWDKIGEMLFNDYCNIDSVEYRNKLRSLTTPK